MSAPQQALLSGGALPIRAVARTYRSEAVIIKGPETASVQMLHLSSGQLSVSSTSGSVGTGEWYLYWPQTGVGNDWEFRYVLTAGSALGGGLTSGTWYRLDTTRTVTLSITGTSPASASSTLTLEYRPYPGGATILSVPGIVFEVELL